MNELIEDGRPDVPTGCFDRAAGVICQQDRVGGSPIPNPDAAVSCPPASDSTGSPIHRASEPETAGRSAEYPVPGRTPEYNFRLAIHEGAGHAYLARCMGTELQSVSIIPGDGYEGRCLSKAYQSSF
jgi:hypothetical protein